MNAELVRYRKKNENLLHLTLPKHIVTLIRSDISVYGLCEVTFCFSRSCSSIQPEFSFSVLSNGHCAVRRYC